MKMIGKIFLIGLASLILFSCRKYPEMTLEEIAEYRKNNGAEIFEKTVYKPWKGEKPAAGKIGGTWNDTILNDPKTFNHYIAERDGESQAIIGNTMDALVDYDFVTKKWAPRLAYFSVESDEKNNTLTVHYTLRENLVWSYYGKKEVVPVTSDDVIFWYDEICGDEALQSSGYGQQWVILENGEKAHIDIKKVDDRSFDFVFPRIVADPLLSTNMDFGPGFLYRKAKEKDGIEGIKKLFTVNTDPSLIPSLGRWYIASYEPGQRVILKRNPHYWEKDENNTAYPYMEERILQIVGDKNTEYLLFTQGKQETYSPTPEELESIINNQKDDYTVFSADGSIGAGLVSFNQNPKNKDKNFYEWFTKKEFRQAMSCLLNRDRIISQTYRGLAQPKYDFFPEANAFHNEKIQLKYRFDKNQALKLLESIGMKRDADGIMRDEKGNPVEFDLTVPQTAVTSNDMALIIADECSTVGIKVNIRQTDFQKVIEMLSATYDWQSVIIGLGANVFPSQGSNVWPSWGNLHLWNPLQKTPATEWEARVDYLYNEGCYTNNRSKAEEIWNEYQEILLEQCPVIYLVRPRSFFAIRNKWNLESFFYDNFDGAKTEYLHLK